MCCTYAWNSSTSFITSLHVPCFPNSLFGLLHLLPPQTDSLLQHSLPPVNPAAMKQVVLTLACPCCPHKMPA